MNSDGIILCPKSHKPDIIPNDSSLDNGSIITLVIGIISIIVAIIACIYAANYEKINTKAQKLCSKTPTCARDQNQRCIESIRCCQHPKQQNDTSDTGNEMSTCKRAGDSNSADDHDSSSAAVSKPLLGNDGEPVQGCCYAFC